MVSKTGTAISPGVNATCVVPILYGDRGTIDEVPDTNDPDLGSDDLPACLINDKESDAVRGRRLGRRQQYRREER
jgi:hypothetical protein